MQMGKIERVVYDILRAGSVTGMTAKEIFAAQTDTDYIRETIRSHGIKNLQRLGLVVPIGSRSQLNEAKTQHFRETVWLDAERANSIGREPMRADPLPASESPQKVLVREAVGLIETRLALAKYLEEAIAEDGGHADPSWLARLIVRDWDIKQRDTQ